MSGQGQERRFGGPGRMSAVTPKAFKPATR